MLDDLTSTDARQLVSLALREDLNHQALDAGLDCTTEALIGDLQNARASFVSRGEGIACGIEVCQIAIREFAPRLSLDVLVSDGEKVGRGDWIATFAGPASDILMMERTCLNFMGRLSGISTLTAQYVAAIAGSRASIYDTRKTTPGFRRLEKYAVACGGGKNHRMGLFDAILIKDNHLAFYESKVSKLEVIPLVIAEARRWIDRNAERLPHGRRTVVQLEVDTLEQLDVALGTDCDIVLLDNMPVELLRRGVEMRNRRGVNIELEASGGVNLATVGPIGETGVERISVGALTHSAVNFDIGLDWG